ncbi:MAG: bifunctional (p)ppGpp synthetase/guanosine-3',5'-bis(diphosphate) 3'-pyrophosphohydrolase [Planctomycetes bacterium]|nr:bifunctional (p)ppGpp synthetase/guanosine-3',5'-bis(diphosphate) 3'-pyrophosphohydrolase [Planctomycetota bacterium]
MLGPRFDQALLFACELHRQQVRKGSGCPYVAHLLAVAGLAIEHGADEDQAIAALLHDAVEDQGGLPTLARIEAQFGPRVARIVRGLTDSESTPKPPWRQRKEHYLRHLAAAADEVLLVSCCDKIHNARAILGDHQEHGAAVWQLFTGGRDGTLWYYRELAAIFARRGPRRLAAELGALAATMQQLA